MASPLFSHLPTSTDIVLLIDNHTAQTSSYHTPNTSSYANKVTMSETTDSIPYDATSLDTDLVRVDPHWKVTFDRMADGKISAQYSGPRLRSCSSQHSTAQAAEDASQLGPRLVFPNSVIAWKAFRDIGRTEMTAFTPEALEDAISRGGCLLTFTPPEISGLWTNTEFTPPEVSRSRTKKDEPDGMCGLMP